jgi:hypothetical protein
LKVSAVTPPIDLVTAKRVDQPVSQGTSEEPVPMRLIESRAGRWPGPAVGLLFAKGPSSGSFTSGTAVCSAPATVAVGVMAISHQWAEVRNLVA